MDKNFKIRVLCGFGLFLLALLMMYTFNGIPFRIFFGIFAIVSGIELLTFLKSGANFWRVVLILVEITLLVCSSIYVAHIDVIHIWYIIFGVCGYDIFAYLCGKMIGGKIFKKSRPFPHISKNKTWEGTILGLIISTGLLAILILALRRTDFVYLICGPLALIGDLFESFLKRQFNVKDSNEIVIKNKFFAKLELLVGGSEGHGGFLDRIDSTAFATTILLLFSIL